MGYAFSIHVASIGELDSSSGWKSIRTIENEVIDLTTKKESVDLESKLEAVLYWACKTSGLTREALLGLAQSDQQKWSYQMQREREKEATEKKERARKQALVDKALKNPPACEICGTIMTPKEPIPRFEVGSWTIKSEDPRSWFIVFECLKSSGLGSHGTYTVFPDDPDQKIPREKHRRSVTDGYIPQVI